MDDLICTNCKPQASGAALTTPKTAPELLEKVNAPHGAQGLGPDHGVGVKIKLYPNQAASKLIAMISNCAATHAHFVMDGSGPVYLTPPSLDTWPDSRTPTT